MLGKLIGPGPPRGFVVAVSETDYNELLLTRQQY
jgi:hypothetical protein